MLHPTANADARLAHLHRVLLMMLKDFAAICEREGLRWFANYGTAIGALRHGGFIPWDDDIDLCMPRADLDRLTQLVQDGIDERYCVIDSRINPRYPMATTRFMLKGTRFCDANLATMDFESGIFLDLFPFDNTPDSDALFERQSKRAWLLNKLAITKLVPNPYIAGTGLAPALLHGGVKAGRLVLSLPGLRRIDFNAISYAQQIAYNHQETARFCFFCDTDRHWNVCLKADVFPVRYETFEDMRIPVARHAEKLLEPIYGDFMTPVPEDQRHEHYPDVLDFGAYATL